MAKRGRPIKYPESVFVEILERYAGGEDLMAILAAKGMPDWSTFWKRVMGPNAAPELVAAHARARDSWAEAKVAEAMHITDQPQIGKKVRKGPKGKVESVTHADAVDARRLRVSTRLWFAERVLSRSYGGRTTVQNPDGTPLNVVPVINVTVRSEGKS
jgi:hypothetical protein